MKRIWALILALVLMLALAACGGGEKTDITSDSDTTSETNTPSNSENPATADPTETETQYYQIGDTVSTDIVEFTLDEAELAIALSNMQDETYGMPKEYSSQEDAQNPFVAAKGHTYATFTYTLNNLDRTSFNGELPLVSAQYQDAVSDKQVDCAELSAESGVWESNGNNPVSPVYSWHFVLDVGEQRSFRSFIDLPVEAESLTDSFILTAELPVSDGSTASFSYLIGNQ